MVVNAPDIRIEDGSTYNSMDDPRVTKVGKVLRESSIDEIPQILNVLLGQMSLIGPRPDPPDWINRYPEDLKVFLSVKPGITGYSQAFFRNNADSRLKMQNDAYYATHYSFALDMKILFKTIQTVLGHQGIYRK
jgi:lipopolysaccharide/colanic/teichoic acid biosynthesis glycosyltransferase